MRHPGEFISDTLKGGFVQISRFYYLIFILLSGCAVPVAETVDIPQPHVVSDKALLFIYTVNERAPLTRLNRYEVQLRKVIDGKGVGAVENAGVLSNNTFTYLYVDPGNYAVIPRQANPMLSMGSDSPLGLGGVTCKVTEKCFVRIGVDQSSSHFSMNIVQIQSAQGEQEIKTKKFRQPSTMEKSKTGSD